MKKILRPSIIPAMIWAFVLGWLMLLPSESFPESKLFSYDKLAHVAVFSILSFLVCWGFLSRRSNSIRLFKKEYFSALIITISYSSVLEILQYYIPGRMADWYDFFANSLGGVLGLTVFYIFTRQKFVKLKLML